MEGVTEEQATRASILIDKMEWDWPGDANWFLATLVAKVQGSVLNRPLGEWLTLMFIEGWTLRGMVEREEVVL